MPAMVFASHARNPCELRDSSMPAEAPGEQRVCTRSAPACGGQARPLLLPKLANVLRNGRRRCVYLRGMPEGCSERQVFADESLSAAGARQRVLISEK